MKIAIGGPTGFVGEEVLVQALQSAAVTSVLAITRRPVKLPDGCDASKLQTLVLEDFVNYSDEAKKQLADLDACIWTIAITPTKSRPMPWEDVYRVCHDYAMAALEATVAYRDSAQPLRFVLYSGWGAERDQTKTPFFMPEYLWMRGRTETEALKFAAESNGRVHLCIAKPGFIVSSERPLAPEAKDASVPWLSVEACAAATIKQCVEGIERDTLESDEMDQMGKDYLVKVGRSESHSK